DGTLEQMDRDGNPTLNPFINPDGEKDLYNSRQPADDVANYLGPWSQVLEKAGYPPEEAEAAALQVLPDILRYNRTKPPLYPHPPPAPAPRGPVETTPRPRWACPPPDTPPPPAPNPPPALLPASPSPAPPTPYPPQRDRVLARRRCPGTATRATWPPRP